MTCFLCVLWCLLQIILALGNYMNSSKRGAVYGFKLQSLDLVRHTLILLPEFTWFGPLRRMIVMMMCVCVKLLDTKSTDRTQTLLNYISNVVREKYPTVSLFYNELHYVDKAAAGESLHQSQRCKAHHPLSVSPVSPTCV